MNNKQDTLRFQSNVLLIINAADTFHFATKSFRNSVKQQTWKTYLGKAIFDRPLNISAIFAKRALSTIKFSALLIYRLSDTYWYRSVSEFFCPDFLGWFRWYTRCEKRNGITLVSSCLAVLRLTRHNLSPAMAEAVPEDTSRLTPSRRLNM